jgi:hypothetical protein
MKKTISRTKNLPLYFMKESEYDGGKIQHHKEKIFRVFDDKQLSYNYQISTISLLKLFDSFLKHKNNQRNNNSQVFYMKATESGAYYNNLHKNNKKINKPKNNKK